MITKIVALFLVGMAILAMFGRLRAPKISLHRRRKKPCPKCGAPLIGKGPCPCAKTKS